MNSPRLAYECLRCNPRAVITITNLNPEDKAREAYRKGGSRFEELLAAPFPQAAREFAEKTIDQSREAVERSNRSLEAAVQILADSVDAARQGAAALRRQIIDTAQRNLNLSFDLAKGLVGASNLSQIVDLQAAYWRKQFDAFTTQAEEVGNRPFQLGAAKPKAVETSPGPIQHEPAKEAPPPAQEAPKNRQNPPARDPAAERQRRNTQEFEAPLAAGSAVRKPDETQLETRHKGGAGGGPRRMQRPSARVSAAEGVKQKPEPRPPSGLVAPPGGRPPDARQSGSPKKVLRKTRLSKAFRPRSNLASLMGTRSALRALRLGGWSMAFGAQSLQTRFS